MTKLPCVWNLCSVAILLLILGEANGFLVTSHTGRWKASNIPLTRRSRPSGLKTKMSAFNEDVDAVVVGGGVSGLSAAFYLKKGGARVLLSEKSTRAGGNIETRKDQAGYIFEDGPNTFNPTQPMLEWISDLGLSEKLVVCDPKLPRYVFHTNELSPSPPRRTSERFVPPTFTDRNRASRIGSPSATFARAGGKGIDPFLYQPLHIILIERHPPQRTCVYLVYMYFRGDPRTRESTEARCVCVCVCTLSVLSRRT